MLVKMQIESLDAARTLQVQNTITQEKEQDEEVPAESTAPLQAHRIVIQVVARRQPAARKISRVSHESSLYSIHA